MGLTTSLFGYLGQESGNFAPRLGFAYQIEPRTVVRGAFGIFFNLIPGSYMEGNAFSNIPFEGVETFSQPAGAPTITMNAPFSATGAFAANPTVDAQHSTVTPYTEAYNLAIERELGKSLGEAFCDVWLWAEKHYDAVERSRAAFREKPAA